jgi:integrase
LKLTDRAIRALQPTGKQVMYRDDVIPGFGVRITPKGAKSFALMHGPQRTITTLGRYPLITLADAREAAKRILAQKTLGQYQPRSIRFSDALDLFVKTHCSAIKTGYEYERMLRREFFPSLQSKTLDKITPHDLLEILDQLSPAVAYHAFTYLKAFFNWAIRRSYLDHSPLVRMQRPKKGIPRDRVLTDDELRRVWRAAEELDEYGRIVQLLILWGSRRGEVAALKWDYITPDWVIFPGEVVKNGRVHRIPLTPLALRILSALPHTSDFVFPAPTKNGHMYVFAKLKQQLDATCGIDFVLHDLRRTFATRLAEMGIAPHVIERLLNHSSGTISGVAAIYNRFQYIDEMRAAIAAMETRLTSLLKS